MWGIHPARPASPSLGRCAAAGSGGGPRRGAGLGAPASWTISYSRGSSMNVVRLSSMLHLSAISVALPPDPLTTMMGHLKRTHSSTSVMCGGPVPLTTNTTVGSSACPRRPPHASARAARGRGWGASTQRAGLGGLSNPGWVGTNASRSHLPVLALIPMDERLCEAEPEVARRLRPRARPQQRTVGPPYLAGSGQRSASRTDPPDPRGTALSRWRPPPRAAARPPLPRRTLRSSVLRSITRCV